MKKQGKQKIEGFDQAFDTGEVFINFKDSVLTEGLSQTTKLPPLSIPVWLAVEIKQLAKLQANSKASVVRQLLVEAVQSKQAGK